MAPRERLRGISAFAISLEAVTDLLNQDPGPVILIVQEDIYWHTDCRFPPNVRPISCADQYGWDCLAKRGGQLRRIIFL